MQCLLIIKQIIIIIVSNVKTMCEEREPNGIPVNKLERLSTKKNKKVKKVVRKCILKSIPVLSKMYQYTECGLMSAKQRQRSVPHLSFIAHCSNTQCFHGEHLCFCFLAFFF